MQSQVRFKRVPKKVVEKVPEKVSGEGSGEGLGGFGASQVQQVPEKVAEAKPGQVHLIHGNPAEVFPALGFPARFRKICKNNTLRLLRIPPKLKLDSFVFPQQQNFAMGSLAQISSDPAQLQHQVLDKVRGVLCRYLVRFRRVPVQIPCEVPEGSGAETL